MNSKPSCLTCGRPLPAPAPRGRPRVRCESCAADKSALGRAWRATHRAEVAAYNLARRNATASRSRPRDQVAGSRPQSAVPRNAYRIPTLEKSEIEYRQTDTADA
jgi:hypothetical protein